MTLLDLIREKSTKTNGTIVDLIKAIELGGVVYVIQQEFSLVEPKLEFAIIDENLNIGELVQEMNLSFENKTENMEFEKNNLEVELK